MNSPKTLLVLSAGYYNQRVFSQIKELGYWVIATDRNPDAPGFQLANQFEAVDITDKDATLDVARRYKVNGVMALNDFGVPTAAYVSQILKLPGVNAQTAEAATDKGVMRDVWHRAGLAIPNYRVVHSLDEAVVAADQLEFPLVMKPTSSGGAARGVSVLKSCDEVEWAYQFALPFIRQGNIILEEFLDGTEMSIEALTYMGCTHILAMADKVKPPAKYQVTTSINYPAYFSEEILKQVTELVIQAVDALGIHTGASHTEVMVTSSGPKLIEMAARPGGGHIFSTIVRAVSGVNMVQELARILVGQEPDLEPKFQQGCVYRFFNPPPGIVHAILGVEKARALPGVVDLGVSRKVGERINELVNGFERSGYLVTTGRERDEAIACADRAEKTVLFDIEPPPIGGKKVADTGH